MSARTTHVRPFKVFFGQATQKYGRFSHEAHVYVAWLMLQDAPALLALAEFRRGLRQIAQASGKADKYHETLTVAWFLLVLERRRAGETWEEFIARHPDLLNAGLVQEFYAFDVMRDERARREFIAPQ
ncbi:hypothetical protein [Deinococcus fonticola]|uniref:hypothetical protein n=1 Tax=Deinococcus fonticola TaxID=2528713 RepID=UPI0010752310|nr:hypothetical protein [Deinococcus fonticola]